MQEFSNLCLLPDCGKQKKFRQKPTGVNKGCSKELQIKGT